jgi:osmotically-inducible protein OsmY
MVDSAEQRTAAGEVAAAVEGVRELDNQLRTQDALRPRFN